MNLKSCTTKKVETSYKGSTYSNSMEDLGFLQLTNCPADGGPEVTAS